MNYLQGVSVVAITAVLVMSGCRADLVVKEFTTTGSPTLVGDRTEVPVRVVVHNQGSESAEIFKVSTDYTGSNGTFVVPFTVSGESSIWYPYTDSPLAAGADVTFEGDVVFTPSLHGHGTVSIRALADSCSGDEFMPAYCRVQESDEDNNTSADISVDLP